MIDNAIGIRVTPKEIFYTIIEGRSSSYHNEKIVVPKALDFPRQLSFIRTTLFSLICEHEIKKAGLRTTEGSAQKLNIERINIEGVIQELLSNSTVNSYFAGTTTSIASRIGIETKEVIKCYKGENNYLNVDDWSEMNEKFRESYLAAMASFNS